MILFRDIFIYFSLNSGVFLILISSVSFECIGHMMLLFTSQGSSSSRWRGSFWPVLYSGSMFFLPTETELQIQKKNKQAFGEGSKLIFPYICMAMTSVIFPENCCFEMFFSSVQNWVTLLLSPTLHGVVQERSVSHFFM